MRNVIAILSATVFFTVSIDAVASDSKSKTKDTETDSGKSNSGSSETTSNEDAANDTRSGTTVVLVLLGVGTLVGLGFATYSTVRGRDKDEDRKDSSEIFIRHNRDGLPLAINAGDGPAMRNLAKFLEVETSAYRCFAIGVRRDREMLLPLVDTSALDSERAREFRERVSVILGNCRHR